MYFARRNRQRIKGIAIAAAGYSAIVAVVALLFPRENATYARSFIWWFAGIPVGLFAWVALEYVGTKLTELSFWQRMPSVLRIALLVIIIVAVMVAVTVALQQA